ncbi:glycosyltransferase family 2 protein [Pontibacter sp. CAU 1760]
MMFPLVSVIISLYNKEDFIGDTINAVLNQTYSNLEIIVVDDGSTDNSRNIVQKIRDSRVKFYCQTNKGPGAAQNFGFHLSSGTYIKFLDADDLLKEDTIEGQVNSLKNKVDSISYVEWQKFQYNVPSSKNIKNTIHKTCTPIEYLTFEGRPQMLQSGQFLLPRKIFANSGLWNENLTLINDTEFYIRLFLSSRTLIFSERGMLFYRVLSDKFSVSKIATRRAMFSAIISTDLSAKYLLDYESSERVLTLIGKMYQMVLEWTYPEHKTLTKLLERRHTLVPKKYWKPTPSGFYFNLLMKIFGWKLSKRAQLIYYSFKY